MANFAKIGLRNLVVCVEYVDDIYLKDSDGNEQENLGIQHLARLTNSENWIQCSFNTRGGVHYDSNQQPDGKPALRKNYPSAYDYFYDFDREAFVPKKPSKFPSWVLNDETCLWEPPVAKPSVSDLNMLAWDEENVRWIIKVQDGTFENGAPRYVLPE
jgi:hypothetical protein